MFISSKKKFFFLICRVGNVTRDIVFHSDTIPIRITYTTIKGLESDYDCNCAKDCVV